MNYLPIFLDVRRHRIVIAGGGAAAMSKLHTLGKTSADVHVFDALPEAQVAALAAAGAITLHRRTLTAADLDNTTLVFLAHTDVRHNRAIHAMCRRRGVLVNTVDDSGASDFLSPAIVDRDPVIVAIGSEGSAPMLVRQIKSRIESLLDADTGALARLAASLRPRVQSALERDQRKPFWQRFFAGSALSTLRQLGYTASRRYWHTCLGQPECVPATRGHVSLVGAGPGDPELLTLRARKALHDADVVLYDRLVDTRILDLARREALMTEVGKGAGGRGWQQADINSALIEHATAGRQVVRLKSGDPLIFGRADEELDALDGAGISVDVVPGITSAAAAAARIGRSLTRRNRNSAVTFLTAQDVDGLAEHNWRSLAQAGATSAIYMGVKAARFVEGRLLLHGADPHTPVTIVENATRDDERVVTTRLEELSTSLTNNDISGPAIIFIGLSSRSAAVQNRTVTRTLAQSLAG